LIQRYIFIDDFCGSGSQAIDYSKSIVEEIKSLNPKIRIEYLVLFGTKNGLDLVRKSTKYDRVDSVFELDDTFNCFGNNSRYFDDKYKNIIKDDVENMCRRYGTNLMESILERDGLSKDEARKNAPQHGLGFNNGQLLIGFHHNTPDNTLPIIWYDESEIGWMPIFPRYNKIYGE